MRTQIANYQCIVENPGQSNAVLMLHGFGADYSDLVPLAEIIDPDENWTWIFPNAPNAVNIGGGMTGRAWFPIDIEALNQSMMTGVPRDYSQVHSPDLEKALPDLLFFIDELKQTYDHLVIGGFSQGGMIASHLFGAAGEKLAGGLLLSTVLMNEKTLLERLEGLPPKRLLQSHGTKDPLLAMKYAQPLYQMLKKKGWKTSWMDFVGGHEIPMPVLLKAREFLQSLLEELEV